jgi:hypothetical protein
VAVLAVLTCATAWAQCGCGGPVAVQAYYPAPVAAAPVVAAYYAPPVYSTYYAPAPVYSTYYAPAPVYSTYYAAPVVAPYGVYYGGPVVVRPRYFVPGQPVRNAFRAIWW